MGHHPRHPGSSNRQAAPEVAFVQGNEARGPSRKRQADRHGSDRKLSGADQDHPGSLPRTLARAHEVASDAEIARTIFGHRQSEPITSARRCSPHQAQAGSNFGHILCGPDLWPSEQGRGLGPADRRPYAPRPETGAWTSSQMGIASPKPGRRCRPAADRLEADANLRSAADRGIDRSRPEDSVAGPCHPRRLVRAAAWRNMCPSLAPRRSGGLPAFRGRKPRADQGGIALQIAQEREGAHRGACFDCGG